MADAFYIRRCCFSGNKIDLEKNRHVTVSEAEEYANSVGAKHVHTSAKLNKGIDELFLSLTKSKLRGVLFCCDAFVITFTKQAR